MLLMLYLQFFQLQRLESICYPYFLLQPKQEKQLEKLQKEKIAKLAAIKEETKAKLL